MVKTCKNQNVRENLLEVGVSLFSEHGYHGTGIKEIVDTLGIPKGSFYNYFQSKEEFAAEIIRHYAGLLAAKWKEGIKQGPPDNPLETLRSSFILMIEHHETCSVKTGCLVGNLAGELAESSELCRRTLNLVMDSWCEHFAYHLKQAQDQGLVRQDLGPEELAELLWNAWEGSLLRMKIGNSTEPLRRCIALLFGCLLKPA